MASKKKKIPDLPEEIECPHCAEELEKEEDGSIPSSCYECGEDVPASHWQVSCPLCSHPRKRKKDKKYAKFCAKCKYNYLTGGKICTYKLPFKFPCTLYAIAEIIYRNGYLKTVIKTFASSTILLVYNRGFQW